MIGFSPVAGAGGSISKMASSLKGEAPQFAVASLSTQHIVLQGPSYVTWDAHGIVVSG